MPTTALVLAAAGCGADSGDRPTSTDAGPTSSPFETPVPAPSESETTQRALRVVVVGDSNTTGLLPTLDDGIDAGMSWIALVPPDEIEFAGGWARNGATSTDMREAAIPMADADAVVIMAGTNNLAFGMPLTILDEDLKAISATVGAQHTVIAAIAPLDPLPADAVALNAHLAELAAAEGWTFVDPWAGLRNVDGTWVERYLTDGIHTDRAGYQAMASAMGEALVAAFGQESSPAAP